MKELEIFGLSKNESKLYQALLILKKAGAGELSKESRVPQSRVYDYLDSLIEKGFITIFPGPTKQFIPASPEDLKEIIKKKKKELDNANEIVEKLSKIYKTNPHQPIEFLTGKKNFWKFMDSLPEAKKTSYRIKYNFDIRPGDFSYFKKNKKKINFKTMGRVNEDTIKNVKKWIKIGDSVKPIENEGVAMAIIDETYVAIILMESNGTLVIRDKAFVKLMKDLFITKFNSIK